MPMKLMHDITAPATQDERNRQDFISSLRAFVLQDVANEMRATYTEKVAPRFTRQNGKEPENPSEVHHAMRGEDIFKMYSAMRVTAQEMVWDSVAEQVERNAQFINQRAAEAANAPGGKLETDPDFAVPRSVSAIDVHRMPGSYDSEYASGDASGGALYDNGFVVFSMGLMGKNSDDIGATISTFIKARYPEFDPKTIVDLGCTIGHNSVPWAQQYPDAEVIATDVAAPGLRYGLARAKAQNVTNVSFKQMDATKIAMPDNSVDLVWSSMFLHELPVKDIRAVFREAHRVLRPGGMMLHMELPPNDQMTAYDGFYLDWDSWYNNEPYYKAFRDLHFRDELVEAGFDADKYIQHVIPSLAFFGPEKMEEAIAAEKGIDKDTGRLDAGLSWFCFGAWK